MGQRFDPAKLREMRGDHKPAYIAYRTNRSVETIRAWESGKVTPNAVQLERLADLYRCDVGDFYSVDEVVA